MVLTNDGALQAKLTQPGKRTGKIYYVQVEGEPDDSALQALRDGVNLKDGPTLPLASKGGGTRPALAAPAADPRT